jgi:hypothetical protein
MTYAEWMRAVDRKVTATVGMSVADLPDFMSRDSFDAGDTPKQGAQLAIDTACDAFGFEPGEFQVK